MFHIQMPHVWMFTQRFIVKINHPYGSQLVSIPTSRWNVLALRHQRSMISWLPYLQSPPRKNVQLPSSATDRRSRIPGPGKQPRRNAPKKKGQKKTGSQKLEGLKKIASFFFCLGRQLKEFFQVPICSNRYFFCGDIIVNPAPGQRKRKPYSSSLPKEGQQLMLPKAWRVYKKTRQISSMLTLSVITGMQQTNTNKQLNNQPNKQNQTNKQVTRFQIFH